MARMAVTEQMYQEAYRLGTNIWSRRITPSEARRTLENEYGLNAKTASAYLGAYDGLRRGRTSS